MVKFLHDLGIKSEFAYIGGAASILFSLLSWFASRQKKGDDKAQADRWGIFIGVALRLEEQDD